MYVVPFTCRVSPSELAKPDVPSELMLRMLLVISIFIVL